MAQRRFWNFKDDDYTLDMNHRELGIFAAGKYRGFEYSGSTSGLTLVLEHTATGIEKVALDGTFTDPMGLWVSMQGTIITEDASISLPISANLDVHPRIDLVVGRHAYVAAMGGAVATYSIVMGSPASVPLVPNLPNPATDVVLGAIHIPGLMSSLDPSYYTPSPCPDYADDSTVAHLERIQSFSSLKSFSGLSMDVGSGQFDIADTAFKLGFSQTVGTAVYSDSPEASYFYISGTTGGAIPAGYIPIDKVTFATPRHWFGQTPPRAQRKVLYCTYPVKIIPGNIETPQGREVYLEAYTPIVLEQVNGDTDFLGNPTISNWVLLRGGETRNDSTNKVRGLVSHSQELVTSDTSFRVARSTSQPRNVLRLTNTNVSAGTPYTRIDFISTYDYSLDSSGLEYGTEIVLFGVGSSPMELRTAYQSSPSAPLGYKPILNPNGWHIRIDAGGSVTLRETANYWVVTAKNGEIPYWETMVDGAFSAAAGLAAKMNGAIYLQGQLLRLSSAGTLAANSGVSFYGLPQHLDVNGQKVFLAPNDYGYLGHIRMGIANTYTHATLQTSDFGTSFIGQFHDALPTGTGYNIPLHGMVFGRERLF